MAIATVRITISWWLRWYLEGVSLAAQMTGATPDYMRVRKAVMRGAGVKPLDGGNCY